MTFEPKFYPAKARYRYHQETYAKKQQRKQNEQHERGELMDSVNPEHHDVQFEEDDALFDAMFNEHMRQPSNRDYGPAATEKVSDFDSRADNLSLTESTNSP